MRAAVALGAALATVAAIVVVLLLHPWNRHVGTFTVQVVETDPGHKRALSVEPVLHAFRQAPAPRSEVITVDSDVRDQTIDGFGAAMTDSSAWLLQKQLSPTTEATAMNDLFAASGIHLNDVLIPMAASDFTRDGVPYAYPSDHTTALHHFSVSHDNAYILPALQAAQQRDQSMNFIATPWSVPAWMKANDKLSNKHNAGTLKPADYQAYANYFVEFLIKYSHAGIDIGEVTPANEPQVATAYPGMNISSQVENTLIDKYLVPTITERGYPAQVYGSDLGWGNGSYARTIATGAAARDGKLNGIAWHCYYGSPTVMEKIEKANPKLGVQMTECSPGISTVAESEVVIESLRNDASVVDLWNLALDDRGGPVQPPNHGCPGCYGLLRIDTKTHTLATTSAYDELGQASKYIEADARVVKSNTFVRYHYTGSGKDYVSANVDDVAVRNPDGTMVVVAYNNAPVAKTVTIVWRRYAFHDTIPAGATVTFRWGAPHAA